MPGDRPTEIFVPLGADGPYSARAALDRLGIPSFRADDLRLLASELVTLSIRHGDPRRSGVAMRVVRLPESVRIEVDDVGDGFAARHEGIPTLDGTMLIERLADRSGVFGEPPTGWAEVRLGPWD